MSAVLKKIVYLMDVYDNPWGGTEGQLFKLLERIPQYGYETKMVVFKSNQYIENHNLPCKIEVLGISKLFSLNAFKKMYKLARQLKKENVELVHIYFNDASILAPVFLKFMGLKVIISRRDMGYWYSFFNIQILRINRLFVDKVVVNSEAVKSVTVEKEKYPYRKIKLIYNGFDLSENVSQTKPGLRKKLNLAEDCIILGLAANLRPIKRMDDVIRALEKVLKEINDVHLVIMGEDEVYQGQSLQNTYTKLARELGVGKNVHFIGVVREIKPYLEEINIGIMSSESEGLSNSIIEYMAAGKPSICTNCEGNAELIKDGDTGLLYKAGDISDLAAAIVSLVMNKEKAIMMGNTARNSVKKKFDIKRYTDEYAELYGQLVCK